MVGIIGLDYSGGPDFAEKPLHPSRKQKTIIVITMIVLLVTVLWVVIGGFAYFFTRKKFRSGKNDSSEEDSETLSVEFEQLVTNLTFICLIVETPLIFFVVFGTIRECFFRQAVYCLHSAEGAVRKFSIRTFLIIFILLVLLHGYCFTLYTSDEFEKNYEHNRNGELALSVWLLAAVYFHRKYCKCKTCNNLTDVKINYMDQNINLIETQKINSKFLLNRFAISLSSSERLSLTTENEQRLITFYTTEFVYLHEGPYCITVINVEEEVKITYHGSSIGMAQRTSFNATCLREKLNIQDLGILGIQNEQGQIVHYFYSEEWPIVLLEGNYVVKILNFDLDHIAPLLPNPSKQPQQRQENTNLNPTMLNVD